MLSKLASVAFNHLTKEILVEVLEKPSTEEKGVKAIVEEEEDNWMTPIIRCLEEGVWPEDLVEARSLWMKIPQYVMENGILFKKIIFKPYAAVCGALTGQLYYQGSTRGVVRNALRIKISGGKAHEARILLADDA